MQTVWSIPLLGLLVLSSIGAALADWQEGVTVDRLTGKKSATITNAALNSTRQFGRKVSARLVIQCIETSGRAKQPSAAIIFSERVATEAVRTKYRIDNDPVQRNKLAAVRNDGATLGLDWSDFVSRLPSSSILRIEFSLPWAHDALIEFDTTGSAEAFGHIPCGLPRR